MKLIDKSALVAEIEERKDNLISLSESCPANTAAKSGFYAQAQTLEGIKNFINTLEVRGMDLEKEIHEWLLHGDITDTRFADYSDGDIIETAKHFFELGLTQKGE